MTSIHKACPQAYALTMGITRTLQFPFASAIQKPIDYYHDYYCYAIDCLFLSILLRIQILKYGNTLNHMFCTVKSKPPIDSHIRRYSMYSTQFDVHNCHPHHNVFIIIIREMPIQINYALILYRSSYILICERGKWERSKKMSCDGRCRRNIIQFWCIPLGPAYNFLLLCASYPISSIQ